MRLILYFARKLVNDHPMGDKMKNNLKLCVIFFSFALASCATPVIVNPADPTTQQAAVSFTVKPETAKVYFVGGRTGSGMSLKVAMVGGAEFIVNGTGLGQIDRGDALVVDLAEGTYNFSWRYPAGDSKMNFLEKQVKAGDIVILQADWNTGGSGFGFIGAALAPAEYQISEIYDRTVLTGKRFVVPINCSPTICR